LKKILSGKAAVIAISAVMFILASCAESTCPAYTMNDPLMKKPGFPERQFNTTHITTPRAERYSDKFRKKLEKSIKKTNRDNIFVRG
jgi:hypothetical protein